MGFEAIGILIEKMTDISGRQARPKQARAKPQQVQVGAEPVVRVEGNGADESLTGRLDIAQAKACLPEREPGGSPVRRDFKHLQQQICRHRAIALGQGGERIGIAPVGPQIA